MIYYKYDVVHTSRNLKKTSGSQSDSFNSATTVRNGGLATSSFKLFWRTKKSFGPNWSITSIKARLRWGNFWARNSSLRVKDSPSHSESDAMSNDCSLSLIYQKEWQEVNIITFKLKKIMWNKKNYIMKSENASWIKRCQMLKKVYCILFFFLNKQSD